MKKTPLLLLIFVLALGFSGCQIDMHEFTEVTTYAGTPGVRSSTPPADGLNGNVITNGAGAVSFSRPEGMAIHGDWLYIGDGGTNRRVRRIRISGVGPVANQIGNVQTLITSLGDIRGIVVDSNGDVIFTDHHAHQVKKYFAPDFTSSEYYGQDLHGTGGGFADGPANAAMFRYPTGVTVDSDGHIYVADTHNFRIRKIDYVTKVVSTLAGSGENDYIDGKGTAAAFKEVIGLVMDKNGDLITADSWNQTLRYIDLEGNTGTYVSFFGDSWGFVDGTAGTARGGRPQHLHYHAASGIIYFTDNENAAVRAVTPGYYIYTPNEDELTTRPYPTRKYPDTRIETRQELMGRFVYTLAGYRGFSRRANNFPGHGYRDGSNTEARFNTPRGMAVAPNGDIYVADMDNYVIRRIVKK